MLNLDPAKLLIIAVVAVILLGPDRLPAFARQVGGFWRTFNEYRHRMESEVRNSMPDLPSTAEIARLARSPSALLNHLSAMSPEPGPDKSDDADVAPTISSEEPLDFSRQTASDPIAPRPTPAVPAPVLRRPAARVPHTVSQSDPGLN